MTRHVRTTIAGLTLALYVLQLIVLPVVLANPAGPNVVGGQAAVSGLGTSAVTITQASQAAVINWQSFNIAPNEVTRFIQPNVQAIALNRIFDAHPSQILGQLQANGTVILQNQNGILFGRDAQVNVGGLVATSLNLSASDFLRGYYSFQGSGVEGWVKNAGTIHAGQNGVYLLAPNVENSGIITSPGGQIVLGAGKSAFLSNHPDGSGFLAEITAPTGTAVNVKDLIADGGHVTMAGQVVNQSGLIQANSIREKNGKIELLASEALTLADGSRTLARGGSDGISAGGTIKAIADLKTGTATFQKGAVIDVSGGKNGGNGGFAEVSGAAVKLGGQFLGRALPGFTGGRFLIDPTVDGSTVGPAQFASFEGSGASNVEFRSPLGSDLTVRGAYDLLQWQSPAVTSGTLTFTAGNNLRFVDFKLTNSSPTKWDYVGTAGGDILFTRSILSTGADPVTGISTGAGGSISLTAAGNIKLVDSSVQHDIFSGNSPISSLRTFGGGDITINAGKDLIASTALFTRPEIGVPEIEGIHIEGTGRLTIQAGGNFLGGTVDGRVAGPGFVIRNTDPTVTPLHTINVGGSIGQTNLPLRADGLPDTTVPINPKTGQPDPTLRVQESTRGYADFAMSNGNLSVTAGKNIYIRRVRDAGLLEAYDPHDSFTPLTAQFAQGFDKNSVSFTSNNGNILLNTNIAQFLNDFGAETQVIQQVSSWLPASFSATAKEGTIQVRSDLNFLPSPTGTIRFDAKGNVEGVPGRIIRPDPNWDFYFVRPGNAPGVPPQGMWVAVDRRTLGERRDVYPIDTTGDHPGAPKPNLLTDPRIPKIEIDQSVPTIGFVGAKPSELVGNVDLNQLIGILPRLPDPRTAAGGSVVFKAGGDITKLGLQLAFTPIPKQVSIEAGGTLSKVQISSYLPDLGTDTVKFTELIPLVRDAITGQLRQLQQGEIAGADGVVVSGPAGISNASGAVFGGLGPVFIGPGVKTGDIVMSQPIQVDVPVPKVATTISANSINLTRVVDSGTFNTSKIFLYGPGSAKIISKTDLDLSDGRGIQLLPPFPQAGQRGGLLDISVGGNLKMDSSRIDSKNGAGISIHGLTEATGYIMGYDNAALHPIDVPSSLRGTVNEPPPVGGSVVIGGSQSLAEAQQEAQGATGIKVIQGGSIGSRAQITSVGQDATVSVTLKKDPTAIAVRANGDINVFTSRVATLGGGDIYMRSYNGNINAGSGSKDEVTQFVVDVPVLDANGNPTDQINKVTFQVPGSGIFTFHPQDPRPLVFPVFNDPEINALQAMATKLTFFGRDGTPYLNQANVLKATREPIFNETVKRPFIEGLKLGDITLVARNGRIIIPPAGIRGRTVTLDSPFLDFQGGTVSGNVFVAATTTLGGTPSFTGTGSGAAATGIAPVSGSSATASTAATSSAVSSSSKSTESVQESAKESANQQAESRSSQVADKGDGDGKKKFAQSIKVKHGVIIQVEVKPQPGS
jgi:filamentous hemagglutinin family protein